jgi:hypothetical protein
VSETPSSPGRSGGSNRFADLAAAVKDTSKDTGSDNQPAEVADAGTRVDDITTPRNVELSRTRNDESSGGSPPVSSAGGVDDIPSGRGDVLSRTRNAGSKEGQKPGMAGTSRADGDSRATSLGDASTAETSTGVDVLSRTRNAGRTTTRKAGMAGTPTGEIAATRREDISQISGAPAFTPARFGRPPGKKSDPGYTQITALVPIEVSEDLDEELLGINRGRRRGGEKLIDRSQVIASLLEEWIERQRLDRSGRR